jgi:uncharacterized protein YdeI (YjbR/CyaY-like superfamily)
LKRETGKPSQTWSESVDEALCFGWIDGVRKSLDAESYTIRFTPRKPTSTWSAINVAKFEQLENEGRMTDAGRAAFALRRAERTGTYSYENRPQELPEPYRAILDRKKRAAKDFDARPPGYRRMATWWVVSARTEPTRLRRLDQLIELHATGRTLRDLAPKPAKE